MVSRVMKKEAKIQERDLWVEGEFLAESDMVEAGMKPCLGSIIRTD